MSKTVTNTNKDNRMGFALAVLDDFNQMIFFRISLLLEKSEELKMSVQHWLKFWMTKFFANSLNKLVSRFYILSIQSCSVSDLTVKQREGGAFP